MAQSNYRRQGRRQDPWDRPQYGGRQPYYEHRGAAGAPRRRKKRAKRKPRWWLLPIILLAIALALTGVFRLVEGIGAGGGKAAPENGENLGASDIRAEGYGAVLAGDGPWIVALDAGHGGGDVGAEGLVNEVEMNDMTVAKLYALLEADPDFTPVRTKEAGQGATPKERVKAAKDAKADLLFSIHGNSDSSPDTSGFECFPAPPGRKNYDGSRALAGLVAREMGEAGAKLRGEGGVRFAYYNAAGAKYFAEASDTSVHADKSFGVLEGAHCPAVLVEQCFITSPADMEAFGGEEGCQRAAERYYKAICSYFKG